MLKQIELLLKYQEADMKLDRFEAKLKISETRKQLMKVRDYLAKQQDFVQSAEQKTLDMQKRLSELSEEHEEMLKNLTENDELLQGIDHEDALQVGKCVKNADRLVSLCQKKRKEIDTISSSLDEMEKNMQLVRTNYPKAKKEFDELKGKYNEELTVAQDELSTLKNIVKKLEKGIDKALLEKYMSIKKNKPMPVARVVMEKCSGCNMEVPSLVSRKLKEAKGIIECENCGRILCLP
ncbi:MAG: C4-type zinc ribbon domain-containing protein [Bacillota bacterium]|nr:C4-type zinc ribbon domain-containing protein [Bacillota bacterium]